MADLYKEEPQVSSLIWRLPFFTKITARGDEKERNIWSKACEVLRNVLLLFMVDSYSTFSKSVYGTLGEIFDL